MINTKVLSQAELEMGVGQRSIIGPLLYLIFINDVPLFLPLKVIFVYADDASVIIHDETMEGLQDKKMLLWKLLNFE